MDKNAVGLDDDFGSKPVALTNIRWEPNHRGGITVSALLGQSATSHTNWLAQVLETVGEFGSASLGLVAWELSLDEAELAPVWQYAVREELVRPVGICPETAEPMFALHSQPVLRVVS